MAPRGMALVCGCDGDTITIGDNLLKVGLRRHCGQPALDDLDAPLTQVVGNQVKVFGWYDNEWGFSSRLVEFSERWCNYVRIRRANAYFVTLT
jgi:hypothetical protein